MSTAQLHININIKLHAPVEYESAICGGDGRSCVRKQRKTSVRFLRVQCDASANRWSEPGKAAPKTVRRANKETKSPHFDA